MFAKGRSLPFWNARIFGWYNQFRTVQHRFPHISQAKLLVHYLATERGRCNMFRREESQARTEEKPVTVGLPGRTVSRSFHGGRTAPTFSCKLLPFHAEPNSSCSIYLFMQCLPILCCAYLFMQYLHFFV